MTDPDAERRAELIAAAVASELADAERAELAAMAAGDPTIAGEIDELRALVAGMAATVGTYAAEPPSEDLRARVWSIGEATPGALEPSVMSVAPVAPVAPAAPRRARREAWPLLAGAAACIALGAGVVLGAQAIGTSPASGPPGTLGAIERVDFTGEPSGVAIDGSLVAHTWGTETVLEIDGLPVGASFAVVLVGADGAELPSGTFLGSKATVLCRMNAAVLRPEVAAVEIRDATGSTVATSTLPEAIQG